MQFLHDSCAAKLRIREQEGAMDYMKSLLKISPRSVTLCSQE